MASFNRILCLSACALLGTATPFRTIAVAQPQSAGTIVFTHAPDGGASWPVEDIYSMDCDGTNVKALTTDGHSSNPAWSPDGQRVLFIHDSALQAKPAYKEEKQFESYHPVELYVMDRDGGNRHLLRRLEPVIHSAVWSPDGRTLAISGMLDAFVNTMQPAGDPLRAGLFLLPANAQGEPHLLFRNALTPSWSPDGKKLAFSVESPRGQWAVHVANSEGSNDVQLTEPPLMAGSPAWSPDGKLIAFDQFTGGSEQQIFVMDVNSRTPGNDAVTRLQAQMDSGEVKLEFEEEFGYLRSVLKALHVSQSSQLLVFSKTSFQAPHIAPRTPRALYFNDEVQVGYVRLGDVLEFAALDPKQGVVFYSLDQEKAGKPKIERRDTCLQCHQSGGTFGVPGLVVRSVFPDHSGMPLFNLGTFVTDHRSPLKERWGGWYVTGTTGSQVHMGNATVNERSAPEKLSTEGTQNVTELRNFIDVGAYLTPHSDIVALMTLEHQTQMANLMIRVGWETRMALYENEGINKALGRPMDEVSESLNHRIDTAVEELLAYMLFREETVLTEPVKGTSGFAEQFAKGGRKDGENRSLRDFDMHKRMFRYPCSYMIYSDAFNAMPEAAKSRLYWRLYDVLTGKDKTKLYLSFPAEQRESILEILQSTKKDLPAYWAGSSAP